MKRTPAASPYMTPAERMERIRHTREVFREHDWDWWDRDSQISFWLKHGVLAIPDVPPGLSRLRDIRSERGWIRHNIACDDWRERLKRKRRINPRFRRIVLARAEGRCCYCEREVPDGGFEIDHIRPVSRGGRSTLANLIAACWKCNQDKSDLYPEEWHDRWYYPYLRYGVPLPMMRSA